MRIVGGMWRGRAFDAPQGRNTRPTTDRMRESLASMILSALDLEIAECSVLDAFAGSGGVGLELLSRGARHCTFCERDRRTAGLVKRNCESLGAVRGTWDVVCGDAHRLAERPTLAGSPFDVVFLDPPYALAVVDVAQLVASLARAGKLQEGCLTVYERSADGPGLEVEGFEVLRSRKHGGTCVDLLQRGATS